MVNGSFVVRNGKIVEEIKTRHRNSAATIRTNDIPPLASAHKTVVLIGRNYKRTSLAVEETNCKCISSEDTNSINKIKAAKSVNDSIVNVLLRIS